MKKVIGIALCTALALCLFSCSSAGSQNSEPQSPPDLTGTWKQTNAKSQDSFQEATISGDTIEVYWVSPDTRSLYWTGSFTAPTEPGSTYTWDSVNDSSKTANAMLASNAETKTFTYDNGELSYEVSALGTTTTVKLAKQ